ncbi:hypothetical protein NPIL_569581 [Nephila pilipes]|uniref:DUF5641 domain-containing protein n=1 Tax=Nephila pilipes TaxID=299642 RepID=A0A8X6QQX0_NEPPI|nr:hypothetical protein NPIL_569581 [Nephila pilipes]
MIFSPYSCPNLLEAIDATPKPLPLWKEKISRDIEVDIETNSELHKWLNNLNRVRKMEIPGWISIGNQSERISLHFFGEPIGDIVLVGSDDKKRLFWPLIRILKLYPGADGISGRARVHRMENYLEQSKISTH